MPDHVPESLTWDQICERYPDLWVSLADVVEDKKGPLHIERHESSQPQRPGLPSCVPARSAAITPRR